MVKSDIRKIGIELSASLHRKIKTRAVERGVPLKQVWEQALTAWMEGLGAEERIAPELTGLTGEDRAKIRLYADMLRAGTHGELEQIMKICLEKFEADQQKRQ